MTYKPDEMYQIIEQCSPGPFLEMFARHHRPGWSQWGNVAPGSDNAHQDNASHSHSHFIAGADLRLFEKQTTAYQDPDE